MTISDSRTLDTDVGGALLVNELEGAGHLVVTRMLVPDIADRIAEVCSAWCAHPDVEAVITTGGTGISARDTTVTALSPLLDLTLPGFGELFRALSFEQIGASAIASRAFAGVSQGTLIFVLPGSPQAVHLAMTRLILPELPHLTRELTKS